MRETQHLDSVDRFINFGMSGKFGITDIVRRLSVFLYLLPDMGHMPPEKLTY